MEGTDVGGTAGVGNYASRYAHGYGVFVESGCDDSSDSDNGSVVNVDVANDFHAVGQTNPMSDSGVVKTWCSMSWVSPIRTPTEMLQLMPIRLFGLIIIEP